MFRVATYVFMDLETTGLPSEEIGKTRITEISFVAVKRDHVLETAPGKVPRMQHKITLCLNPMRVIQPSVTEVTGLCNDLLEFEPTFKIDVFNTLNTFLNILTKPVCLIAQNGLGFDFPILKNHIERLGEKFADDVLCADCYHGFYDILEELKLSFKDPSLQDVSEENSGNKSSACEAVLQKNNIILSDSKNECAIAYDHNLFVENTLAMKSINEVTPRKSNLPALNKMSKARRRFPWSKGNKPKEKYKLKDVYERLLNRNAPEAHRAENDSVMALECAVVLSKQFVKWVDENCIPFVDIQPMTPGVPLGM
ncbi:unnamed protein product [Leptosia nina]|uniref:Exonuclease domain-containing protein n=1 Tax=Leptosia nina TaxID=320188 RepID=A0AAV1J1R1_9NEOP